jgi:hypothetical protein
MQNYKGSECIRITDSKNRLKKVDKVRQPMKESVFKTAFMAEDVIVHNDGSQEKDVR